MNWNKTRAFLAAGTLLLGMGQAHAAQVNWNVPGPATWNADENWNSVDGMFMPTSEFGDTANISNGGTAILDAAVPDVFSLTVSNGQLNVVAGGDLSLISGADGPGDLKVSGSGNVFFDGNSGFSLNVAGDVKTTGTLTYNIGDVGNTPFTLNAGGDANLGGTLAVQLTGTPSFGDSWTVVSAGGSVNGNFANVDTSGAPSLAKGLQYQVNGGTLSVGNTLVATINRDNGSVVLSNPIGGDIDVKGYSLVSPSGLLVPANWTSLNSTGNADWREANPQPTGLSELNLTSSSVLAVNANVDMGNAFDFAAGARPRDEDLELTFATPDGQVKVGIVEYEGDANDLTLKINGAGEAKIENLGNASPEFSFNGIDIQSASGSLLAGGFSSLGAGWIDANSGANNLTQLNITDELTVAQESAVDLGTIFDAGGSQDVTFNYSTAAGEVLIGHVEYGDFGTPDTGTTRLAADFDNDGEVGLSDFGILKGNFGNAGTQDEGDATGDGQVGLEDFSILKDTFGNTAAVPEPSSIVLALMGLVGLFGFARRRNK